MYAQAYASTKVFQEEEDGAPSLAMDVAPGYLFYQNVAQSILCVSPWTKIVIVLRNPMDRLLRQYQYAQQQLGLRSSLQDWMATELAVLKSSGLLQATEGADERAAWNKYQTVRNLPGAIGRSLYVLQLEAWIDTYKRAGWDRDRIRNQFHVICAEEWDAHPKAASHGLMKFLGLSGELPAPPPPSLAAPSLSNDTKRMLKDLFQPYNERLFKLLEEEFDMPQFRYHWMDKKL